MLFHLADGMAPKRTNSAQIPLFRVRPHVLSQIRLILERLAAHQTRAIPLFRMRRDVNVQGVLGGTSLSAEITPKRLNNLPIQIVVVAHHVPLQLHFRGRHVATLIAQIRLVDRVPVDMIP